jgi:hypothetical protein
MIRSMLNQMLAKSAALLASAALGLAFVAAPAQSASFTYSDPTCSSFSIVGSTLVCNKASCSISASPSTNPTPSTGVQLTETCTPAATAWSWQKVSGDAACPAASGSTNPLTLPAPQTTALSCLYEVDVTAPQAGSAQITINWSTAPPLPPSGCTATANPPGPLPIGGGSTTVTVTCSGGGAPTSYAWSANPAVAGLQSTTSVNSQGPLTITQNTSFSVTPNNTSAGGGVGNTAQVSVTVQGQTLGFCNQYGSVIPASPINVTWGQPMSAQSVQSGAFADNTVWVFQITPPAGTPSGTLGYFQAAEFGGLATPRQMTISRSACDFRSKDYTGANGPLSVSNGNTVSIQYQVATPQLFGGVAGLTAGTTYYVNIRNWSTDLHAYSCGRSSCPAIMNEQPASP